MPKCISFQRKYFIDRLLDIDPIAPTQSIPGTNNRLPFTQAVISGLHWHNSPTCDVGDDCDNSNEGPLQSIWKHAPEALYIKDNATGLYPFMLAACCGCGDVEDSKQESYTMDQYTMVENNEICQLDTVYSLLRLYPQVLDC